jgi:hypothetical protein
MATRIIEYGQPSRGDGLPILPRANVVQSALTATGTSQQSTAFSDGTSFVMVQSDEAVYVKVGVNPTATTNDYRIQANGEQVFPAGLGEKAAVRT